MTLHQKIFALVASIILLLIILELVRKRKVKEEYSWLWILTVVLMIILIIRYDLLLIISRLIGAEDPLTTLFLFGFLFLILINIHYSIKISVFTDQIKKMAQRLGIISKEIENIKSKEKTNRQK